MENETGAEPKRRARLFSRVTCDYCDVLRLPSITPTEIPMT
jgi:hypothetical protein